jgi:hypothetical protein
VRLSGHLHQRMRGKAQLKRLRRVQSGRSGA